MCSNMYVQYVSVCENRGRDIKEEAVVRYQT